MGVYTDRYILGLYRHMKYLKMKNQLEENREHEMGTGIRLRPLYPSPFRGYLTLYLVSFLYTTGYPKAWVGSCLGSVWDYGISG